MPESAITIESEKALTQLYFDVAGVILVVLNERLEIVKIKTLPPTKAPEKNYKKEIIERSRKRYYKPTQEIKTWLKKQKSFQHLL